MPGHTQLTRIPSRAYSTAATFASWITAAFVAQYGAACDHAVSPATDAVRTIEPDCCARMTGTAARMPLTAPRTLTRNARSQSSVARLWMRPFGDEHAGVADQHVEPAEALDRQRDDGFDLGDLAHVGEHRLDRAASRPAGRRRVASSDGVADVAQHDVGVGLAGELARQRGAERAARAGDRDDPSRSLIRAGTRRRR